MSDETPLSELVIETVPVGRVEVHGFAVGDRVGHVDHPDWYGHVTYMNTSKCYLWSTVEECRQHCHIIQVHIPGANQFMFTAAELEHLD